MLTFELSDNECLEIHGDKTGLLKLAKICEELANSITSEHSHLMTEEWGGSELTSEKQGLKNDLVNQLKLFKWRSEK